MLGKQQDIYSEPDNIKMIREPYTKHWPRKNLGEFLNFLDRIYPKGYSLQDLSNVTGMSKQNLSQMFIRDDAKLSKMEALAESFGYSLTLYYPQKTRFLGSTNEGSQKHYPNAGNLAGLVKYIQDSNISLNHMSVRVGRSYCLIANAFKNGDIKLSALYEILKNLNINVIWNYEPIDEQNKPTT